MSAPDNTGFKPSNKPAPTAPPLKLAFNLLPVGYAHSEATMHFTPVPLEGLFPFKPAEVPPELTRMAPKDQMPEYFYTNGLPDGPGVPLRVNFIKYPALARMWCMQHIRRLLAPVTDYLQYHNPCTTVFWYNIKRMPTCTPGTETAGEASCDQQAFHRFVLKVIHRKECSCPELLIGYRDIGYILTTGIEEFAARYPEVRNVKKMAFRGQICRLEELPELAWYHSNEVLPQLSKKMARKLKLKVLSCCGNQSAGNEYSIISYFAKTYLLTKPIFSVVAHDGRFGEVVPEDFGHTASTGRQLMFGEGGLSGNPQEGMTAYGPLHLPPGRRFCCFTICFEEDKKRAAQLTACIVTTDASRRLGSFMRIPLRFSHSHSIYLNSKGDAEHQMVHRLTEMMFAPDTVWCAFLICPAKGQMTGSAFRQLHARITELLLHRGVVVQKVPEPAPGKDVNESLRLMGTGLVARLGGTPWRPAGNNLTDPVVGFAVHRGKHPSDPNVGAAAFFAPGGRFAGANSFTPANEREWGGLSVEFLKKWEMNGKEAQRLVLHLPRPLKPHEQASLQTMINDGKPGLQTIVMVIRRCRSRDIRVFNMNDPVAGIPDGTWVRLGQSRYLLHTRCPSDDKNDNCELTTPLTISFQIINAGNDTIGKLAPGLLDQLHCLIRMHRGSFVSPHLPVTLTYPALLARMIPRLRNKALPEYGKLVPWFLL